MRWLRSLNIVQLGDLLDMMELVQSKTAKVDEDLKKMCQDDQDVQRLKTIPGIGDVVATSFVAEIGDINRFSSSERLASYAGLAPIVRQSEETE